MKEIFISCHAPLSSSDAHIRRLPLKSRHAASERTVHAARRTFYPRRRATSRYSCSRRRHRSERGRAFAAAAFAAFAAFAFAK
jgi:hypothetical protein